ncbi:MAG: hypothetical protein ACXWVH_01715 [Caulobacteraceae bacterium]
MRRKVERKADYILVEIAAPSRDHRKIVIEASPFEIDLTVGSLWGEFPDPGEDVANLVLSTCDALRDGRVREVRDRDTGELYRVYRLKSRGLCSYSKEGGFSFLNLKNHKIRDIEVRRIPRLAEGAVD